MSKQKLCMLLAVLLVTCLSIRAMDSTCPRPAYHELVEGRHDTNHAIAPEERRRMDVSRGADTRSSLYRIANSVNTVSLDHSLDETLWVLKKTEYPDKEEDQSTCKDYLSHRKLLDDQKSLARHVLYFYYFESQTDMVLRSGSFRWTYPPGLTLKKPEPVFCECLDHARPEQIIDPSMLAKSVPAGISVVHPTQLVLKCSELQKDSAYVAWQNAVRYVEQISEEVKQELEKKFKSLLRDWHTCRFVATLSKESPPDLFQIGLLQDDYDLVAYLLQHKRSIEGTTFFARSVPMLELLEQYGVLNLSDDHQNNPLHHFAQHGRLVNANVIDFYLKRGVDPFARNGNGCTPLGLLAQYSYRFDSYESKLQKFIALLLKRDAGNRESDGGLGKTVLDLAQETHAYWQLPATRLVLESLK